ncbi:unnamed protein product [Zymoseptoria tritici ST99CH_3D7]|uniref:Zn(2)-C6 fungal-type domain-containing protein n=2 Tax=Zymoseptoria tritici TaxID=1047171 RepID=A0A1X7RD41_ZYMT9|nr:unnamed protein product [Zymoseptoria tritici ST99CH_3D7]SMR41668.1 unnamed protein product [Zymoseptoria tritici ST99CH_1E4]
MPNVLAGKKRDRDGDVTIVDDSSNNTPNSPAGAGASTTNFRNVSACNRCRNRKNRCDQKLPKCTNCERSNVKCVGFDPVSKREIPRSYVYYLETRLVNLEAILDSHGIAYPPPNEDFAISDAIKPGVNVPFPVLEEEPAAQAAVKPEPTPDGQSSLDPALKERDEGAKLERLVNDVGMVSVQGTPDTRFLGSTPGISFARVVFAAVKSSVHQTSTPSEKSGTRSGKAEAAADGTTMRDSFFGLHSKPTIKQAPFPEKDLGSSLTELYFEHANPQIPILHRGEYMALFDRVYSTDPKKRTSRELYMLNMVFAIGSGIILDYPSVDKTMSPPKASAADSRPPDKKRQRLAGQKHSPEEYHSAAIIHLDSFLGAAPATQGVGGGLEELQAVLLLAALALLRPVAPGLWYIIGVAVRLGIDLGLHAEEFDPDLDTRATHPSSGESVVKGLGRKQWTRDLRRRLWWCVFNFDRLVSSCVGRPVSINEAIMTTEFPSLLDDKYITPSGFLLPPGHKEAPSYKFVTHHYIRLRLLQSEILQVLQYRQAHQARKMGANKGNPFLLKSLESQFMKGFSSYREWRYDIDSRLREWKDSAPKQYDTGVSFNPLFLELNYWQAIIMLYRHSLSVPERLASELSPATGEDVHSPGTFDLEEDEDQQMVFLKVAQAGQTVLKIYRQLHRLKLVNYTFLATHHLFMSGISFLYAIWHSSLVRSQLTIDDVDFTILAATSVLTDLIVMCPPAESCRDAFVRMSKATITMVMSTTGFGATSTLATRHLHTSDGYFGTPDRGSGDNTIVPPHQTHRQVPRFDMNLKDLFSEEEIASRPFTHQPQLQAFLPGSMRPPSMSPHLPKPTSPTMEGAAAPIQHSPHHQQRQSQQQSPHLSDRSSTFEPSTFQTPQPHPFNQPQQPSSNDYSFDTLDFLNDFPLPDTGAAAGGTWNTQGPNSDTDLGYGFGSVGGGMGMGNGGAGAGAGASSSSSGGVGAAGFDGSGAWEANQQFFEEFFFGTGAGTSGSGAY